MNFNNINRRDISNRPIFVDKDNFEQGVHLEQDDCNLDENAAIQDLKERIVRLEMEKKELVIENRELQANCEEEETSKVWKKQLGHEKVAFVGYPSSGSFSIQRIISKVSNLSTFSVYPNLTPVDTDESMGANLDIYSECYSYECSLPEGAPLIIRTYYPTVTLQSKLPTIEKIVRIVRNPADNIYSLFNTAKVSNFFASRIRGWNSHVDYEINELKKFSDFWDRFTRDVFTSTLIVRYEDFCVRPEGVMTEIFNFLQLDFDRKVLRDTVIEFQCDPKKHIGYSFSQFSKEQFTKVSSRLSDYVTQYDYTLLYRDV